MRRSIIYLLVTILLLSCDPAYRLVVSNVSRKDKQVQILYSKTTTTFSEVKDSIILVPNDQKMLYPNTGVAKKILTKNVDNGYMFILPSGKDAILEWGFGTRPYPNQKIIIDNADTVFVGRKSKRIIRRPKISFGAEYKLTITE